MDSVDNTAKEPFLGSDNNGIPFIQCGIYRLRLDMEPLDEHYQKRAFEDIGETEELRQKSIDKFRKLIEGEKNLTVPQDDEFLIKFLRPSKHDPEKAFKKMRNMYKLIYNNPKYIYNITPEVVEDVFIMGILHFLPYRADGARIMIIELDKWDPKNIPLEMITKTFLIGVEIALKEPTTQLCGVHVIVDTQGLNMDHVLAFNPWMAKLLMDFAKTVPLRVKGIHVINQPKIFDIAYAVFKPFIRGRLKREIILHGKKFDTLLDHIPPKYLPKQYMGDIDIPNIPGDLMVEMMKFYEQQFQDHIGYGYHKNQSN